MKCLSVGVQNYPSHLHTIHIRRGSTNRPSPPRSCGASRSKVGIGEPVPRHKRANKGLAMLAKSLHSVKAFFAGRKFRKYRIIIVFIFVGVVILSFIIG